MKITRIAILATGLFIAPVFGHAQSAGKITGQVWTAENKPAESATLLLTKENSDDIIKTELTDSAGRFSFRKVAHGNYKISITHAGHKKYTSQLFSVDSQAINLPAITLEADSKMLEGVAVTAKKAMIIHKQDRIIVNADAFISAAGSSTMELLEKAPGVQVDQNGTISLKGRQGVTIYIDDKPSYLSGAELESYLRSLPAATIDQLELMSNPPSRYDAAGSAGIINIKTKKNTKGFNGGLTLSLTQGKKTRSNNSFNFNYRRNKLSSYIVLSHNLNNSFTDLDLYRTYLNADSSPKVYFEQNSYFKRHGNTLNLKTGADYSPSDKTTWGIILSGSDRRSTQLNNNTSNLLSPVKQPDSIIVADNQDRINFKNASVNFNYRRRFKKSGHELTADADYLTYRNKTDQIYTNFSYLPDMTLKTKDILTGNLPNNVDIYSFKTDYTRPLKNAWKLETGFKSSYAKTDNIADYTTTVDDMTSPDYNKSNHFIFKENINALYLNLNREFKKLSVQGGLRLENTHSDGHQLGNILIADSSFTKNYTNLFPVLYLTYKFDSSSVHQLGFNYGRRIERPYYSDLNPFLYPLDKFTYYSGNPFLNPAFSQSFELSHTYKSKITIALSYVETKNMTDETIEIRDGIYYSKPANLGTNRFTTFYMDGDFDLAKWLILHMYAALMNNYTKSNFYNGPLKTTGTNVYISPTLRISMGKGWDGELTGNYSSRSKNAQFVVENQWQANASVQKKLSSRITLKAVVNDIFYSRKTIGTINNLFMARAGWTNRSDSRQGVISLSYRFGKDLTGSQVKEHNSAESEKNRVK